MYQEIVQIRQVCATTTQINSIIKHKGLGVTQRLINSLNAKVAIIWKPGLYMMATLAFNKLIKNYNSAAYETY